MMLFSARNVQCHHITQVMHHSELCNISMPCSNNTSFSVLLFTCRTMTYMVSFKQRQTSQRYYSILLLGSEETPTEHNENLSIDFSENWIGPKENSLLQSVNRFRNIREFYIFVFGFPLISEGAQECTQLKFSSVQDIIACFDTGCMSRCHI